jgi:uncharacterized OsmC-like protein
VRFVNACRPEREGCEVSIAEAVQRASAYLTEHPEEARYRDSAARAALASGLVVNVTGPGGETLTTDMPRGIGGTATAPSPGWYLRAAEASCVVALIAIRAAALGVSLEHVEVAVDSESDDRGILGLDADIPAGALSASVAVTIRSSGTNVAELDAIARWAIDHCPVVDTVRRPVPIKIEVHAG